MHRQVGNYILIWRPAVRKPGHMFRVGREFFHTIINVYPLLIGRRYI